MPSRKPTDKNELFHEIYSVYFKILLRTVQLAQSNQLDKDSFRKMIKDDFSYMNSDRILKEIFERKIDSGKGKSSVKEIEEGKSIINYYKLFSKDLTTIIKNTIVLPFSSLQRRYIKTMLNDEKFRLFFSDEELNTLTNILQDEEELFSLKDICFIDNPLNADPFDSGKYRSIFHHLMEAVQKQSFICVHFKDNRETSGIPKNIEYSMKDNKFRFHISKYELFVSDIIDIQELRKQEYNKNFKEKSEPNEKKLKLEITDQRNALHRCLTHFSHFEKECDKLENGKYYLTFNFSSNDEGEIVMRVLQFGPLIKVLGPESVVERIKEKLRQQTKLKLQK